MNTKLAFRLIEDGHYRAAADILTVNPFWQTPVVNGLEGVTKALQEWKFKQQEHFLVASLDSEGWLISITLAHLGTPSHVPVHPREVFRIAILEAADSIVVAHNHPSGRLIPSDADYETTECLVDAGKIMGIPVLDHVIVATTGVCSIRRRAPMIFD